MKSGKQLKLIRVELDIKAMDIAEHLQVSKSYISKLEKGVQAIPVHMYEKWVSYLMRNK